MAREHVLVVKLGALGDLLLAEGALRDIREHHGGAHITLLTRRAFATLLDCCPWLDEVLIDQNHPRWRLDAMWRLSKVLRGRKFDAIYDLQDSSRSRFYRRWLTGNSQRGTRRDQKSDKSIPVLARHGAQLQAAGIQPRHTADPAADWIGAPVDALLHDAGVTQPFVLLLPGSSTRGVVKRWPHYAALGEQLQARGLLPVIVPGPAEIGTFSDIPGIELLANGGGALDLHGLAGVMRRAVAVVGNDSGPTHLAASLGVPGLALFATDTAQADRTCLGRNRMQTLVSSGFHTMDATVVEQALIALPSLAGSRARR